MQSDQSETYNTDIEMVMDFMKLAILFNNDEISENDKHDILLLEKSIIEVLPVAQSNRMSSIYSLLSEIYRNHKIIFKQSKLSSQHVTQKSNKNYNVNTHTNVDVNNNNIVTLPRIFSTNNKRNDYFIILFYNSGIYNPYCKKVMNEWEKFKQSNSSSNFTIQQYDNVDLDNTEIFKHFNLEYIPIIIKLRLDAQNYIEKLQGDITLDKLNNFAHF